MNRVEELLKKGAEAWGFVLTPEQIILFLEYFEYLQEWNHRLNLTAITVPEEVVEKHFLDSMACLFSAGANSGSLLDVGSGAGFPGVPVKICHPDWSLTLMEARRKKTEFLTALQQRLKLTNTEVLWGRAEIFAQQEDYREQFDWVVARAVASLAVLGELCLPFLREGGLFTAMKGPQGVNEIKEAEPALKLLGGSVEKVNKLKLPFSGEGRVLLNIRKVKRTPKLYPRRPGIPGKKPLVKSGVKAGACLD